MNDSALCLCHQNVSTPTSTPIDDKNQFVCIKCKNRFHISCYDNPTIQILNNTITCIPCRLEICEPYWSLHSNYPLSPQILAAHQPVDLSYSLSIPNIEKISEYSKLVIFCTKLKSTMTNNFYFEWPSDKFEIILNGDPLEYDIYTFAYFDLPKLSIDKKFELKIRYKEPLQSTSVIGVALAKSVELKELAKEVARKNRLNIEAAKKKYEDLKQTDFEFLSGISIRDPLTSFLLYMPVRGFNCDHISCFDLMNFLRFHKTNYNSSRWKCPLCKTTLNITELVIDLHLYKILKDIRKLLAEKDKKDEIEKITHIFIDENGDWKPKETYSNQWSQNNKGVNKEKTDGDQSKIITSTPPVERVEKVIENTEKTEKKIQPNPVPPADKKIQLNPVNPLVVIEIQEDEEKQPSKINYYRECLSIIKTFLAAKSSKGENSFRILQTFKENPLLGYLSPKEIYDLFGEIIKISNFTPNKVLEEVYFQKKKKKIEEICSELKNSVIYELLCKLIIIWAENIDSMLKFLYLLATKNNTKPLEIFKYIEYLLYISEIIISQPEETKKLNPCLMKTFPEILGHYMRSFLEITKIKSKESIKTFTKFLSVLMPELLFPASYSEKYQKNFQSVSSFLNIFLREFSNENFTEIILSLYPSSTKEPSFLDLMVLKKQFRLWAEIFSERSPKIYTHDEIKTLIIKWNENSFLKEQIEKGKLNLTQILNSEI